MKTTKMLVDGVRTPKELASKLLRENRGGGSIHLDDFCAQLKDVPRQECIQCLKYEMGDKGRFVPGRKGHPSRWVYGKMLRDLPPPASPSNRRRNETPMVSTPVIGGTKVPTNSFRLKATINGQAIYIPLDELELVPA
jgi:hypothetical protein